jgi:hypothetical protein
LTTRSLSQYTHFIALNPNLQKHYSNHGLAGQCPMQAFSAVLNGRVEKGEWLVSQGSGSPGILIKPFPQHSGQII